MNDELRKMMLQLFAEGDDPDPKDDPGKGDDPDNNDDPDGGKDDQGDDDGDPEPEKKYTDEDVNKIVKKKIAEERKRAKEEAEKEAKKAKMTAEEKAKFEKEELEKERDGLKEQLARRELSDKAAELFKEKEISATPEMLSFVVGEDEEKTAENVKKFVDIINGQLKLADEKRAKGKTPPKYGENNDDSNMSEIDKRIAKYQ